MNNTELQEKIKNDLQKLPSLEIEILEKKVLYKEALYYAKKSYYCFLMSVVLLIIPDLLIHGEIFKIYKFVGPFIVCALFLLLMHGLAFSRITTYIILRDTVFPKLETGKFLQQKMLWLWHLARRWFFSLWAVLFIWTLIFKWTGNPSLTDFLGGYVMIGAITWIVMHIILSNETNRLGISGLFSLITSLVNRGKIEPNPINSSNQSTTGRTSAFYDPVDIGDCRNPQSPFNPNHPFNSNSTKQD
jgi:hypothetical protein